MEDLAADRELAHALATHATQLGQGEATIDVPFDPFRLVSLRVLALRRGRRRTWELIINLQFHGAVIAQHSHAAVVDYSTLIHEVPGLKVDEEMVALVGMLRLVAPKTLHLLVMKAPMAIVNSRVARFSKNFSNRLPP